MAFAYRTKTEAAISYRDGAPPIKTTQLIAQREVTIRTRQLLDEGWQ